MQTTTVKTQDHEQIKYWIESRDGKPARLGYDSTGKEAAPLTVWFEDENKDVPQNYQVLDYDEFFSIFDHYKLTFSYEENGEDDRYHTIAAE